jgi:hypothetical protein
MLILSTLIAAFIFSADRATYSFVAAHTYTLHTHTYTYTHRRTHTHMGIRCYFGLKNICVSRYRIFLGGIPVLFGSCTNKIKNK